MVGVSSAAWDTSRHRARRRQVEHGLQNAKVRGVAGVLPRVGHIAGHFAFPEQAHIVAVAPEHDERGVFGAVGIKQAEVIRIIVADRLDEVEIGPAAFLREEKLAVDGAAPRILRATRCLMSAALPFTEPSRFGAHRAGTLVPGAVHPEIGDERVLVAEQVDQRGVEAVFILEAVILGDDGAGRKRPTLLGERVA